MSENTQTTEPKKKRKYKRRKQQPANGGFDQLARAAQLISELRQILPMNAIKQSRAVGNALHVVEKAIQGALFSNPAEVIARLGPLLTNGHTKLTNPGAAGLLGKPSLTGYEAPIAASPQPENRIRTVGPESPVLSLADMDMFIAEETPGRYMVAQLGPRELPILMLGREEYGALRSEIMQQGGDVDEFKRDLAKTVPDELIMTAFQSIVAVYRGCAIRI